GSMGSFGTDPGDVWAGFIGGVFGSLVPPAPPQPAPGDEDTGDPTFSSGVSASAGDSFGYVQPGTGYFGPMGFGTTSDPGFDNPAVSFYASTFRALPGLNANPGEDFPGI